MVVDWGESKMYFLNCRTLELHTWTGSSEAAQRTLEWQWKLFLELMRYVEAGSCRHDYILRYFGDEQEMLGGCGHCDVCAHLQATGQDGVERRVSDEDALLVRKALAGVARLRQRAGMVALAASLHGDDTERIRKLGLDTLSTHGLLSDRPKPWIMALLRRLLAAGLIDITPSQYPVPFLTASGVATMSSEQPVRVLPPDVAPARARKRAAPRVQPKDEDLVLDEHEQTLFEALRTTRMDLARERSVPAYVVCGNRTLHQIVVERPTTLDALAAIYGMGPQRIADYGAAFLATLESEDGSPT